MKFSDIKPGDQITLTRAVTDNPKAISTATFTVDRSYTTNSTGPIITSGSDLFFYESDGWTVTLLRTANGFPVGAAAIMWSDSNHEDHIAFSTGHPNNKIWSYNGVQTTETRLVEQIRGFPITALDFRP